MRRFNAFGRKRRNRLIGLAVDLPWTPASDPDLSAWYDVEDTSERTVNGGGFITSIRNKADPVPDYNNANPGEIPALVSVDGHDMAHFDGVTDYWQGIGPGASGVQPGADDFTVAMLVRVPATTSTGGFTWMVRDQAGQFETWWLTLQQLEAEFLIRDTGGTAIISGTDETWADGATRWLIIGQRDNTAGNIRLLYATGPTLNESTASPVAIVNVGNINAVNSRVGAQSSGTLSNFWEGDIGEWLMIKRAMTAAELGRLVIYFTRKWELTGP